MGISFFKIALLVSYLRLLQDTSHKMYRLCVWIAIAFVFFSHLGCTLSLIFACTPVERSWRPLVAGTCIPDGPSFTAYAAITIASDIIVALMPIPVLLKINIGTAKKLGLIGMFTLGLFTTVCSILRYSQIYRIQYGDHDSTMLVVWGVIEFNVGVSYQPFLIDKSLYLHYDRYRTCFRPYLFLRRSAFARPKNTAINDPLMDMDRTTRAATVHLVAPIKMLLNRMSSAMLQMVPRPL